MMKIIGLTGGIASGKSTFSGMLRKLGAPIIDADEISRSLTAPGGKALPSIRERFGDGVFNRDGTLIRSALAEIVFGNYEARQALESIVHPLVIQGCLARLDALREVGLPAAALDVPLLIESGMDSMADEVWLTYAPEHVQLERIIARDHLTVEQAQARIASQAPFHAKAGRADVIIPMVGSFGRIRAIAARQWARVSG